MARIPAHGAFPAWALPMVIYQVKDVRQEINTSFLRVLRQHQASCEKGVYGWYVLTQDVRNSFQFEVTSCCEERIYLYIGTVTAKEGKSVTSRFIGELFGAQISTDKHKSFDTDFTVSCAIDFLVEKGLDVHFHVLDDDITREVEIARKRKPILQKVTSQKVSLRPEIKKKIRTDVALTKQIEEVGDEVKRLLGQRLAAETDRQSKILVETATPGHQKAV